MDYMQIVVGGASGFLGSALIEQLRSRGHHVTRLVRGGAPADDASHWDPVAGIVDVNVINQADAVINLSGAPVAHWPWTKSYKQEIASSRIHCTMTLAQAVADSPARPAFISASGMSAYGSDRGGEVLTESSSPGISFLAGVVHDWEAAAAPAIDAGSRVCFVRTSLVLDHRGGTLKLLLPIFKFGLGGRVGSGKQYFSVISLADWVRGVEFLTTNGTSSGPYNFANPHPVTNAEFTKELGRALHRKTFFTVPAFALRTATGGLADELLGSLRVVPERLLGEGFGFADPDISSVISTALK